MKKIEKLVIVIWALAFSLLIIGLFLVVIGANTYYTLLLGILGVGTALLSQKVVDRYDI